MARLRDALVVGDDVVLVWDDGEETYLPGPELRRACTCAGCKGEEHLFGARSLPVLKPLGAEAFRPVAARPVGNYGLEVTWGDGHDHGIYHLEALRSGTWRE